MNVKEAVSLFRSTVRDQNKPYLWTDEEVLRYLTRAVNRLARRADYFLDKSTYNQLWVVDGDSFVPTTSIPTGEASVPVTPSLKPIVRIVRAKLTTLDLVLRVRTMDELDREYLDDDYGVRNVTKWDTNTGAPKFLVTDFGDTAAGAVSFRIVPTPSADDRLDLTVYRTLLSAYDEASMKAEVEIPLRDEDHADVIIEGMQGFAYNKKDAEVYDPDLAIKMMALFDGHTLEVKKGMFQRRRKARAVRYGGI